jgi:hypothetical protein
MTPHFYALHIEGQTGDWTGKVYANEEKIHTTTGAEVLNIVMQQAHKAIAEHLLKRERGSRGEAKP